MKLELSGKTALVTGSSRGIGRAIAEALCAEGCQVAVNARNADRLQTCASAIGASVAIVGDVANPVEARGVVDEALRVLGQLDILICNVGSGSSVSPGDETYEEWQRVFALNLWSTTNTVEAAREALTVSRGVIVCVSSICGLEVVPGAPVTYSAAKAALHAYVRGIARPLGKMGIRINAVAPGNILSDGSVWARKLVEDAGAVQKMLGSDVALGRLGTPKDVAELVVYLASARTDFATGGVGRLTVGRCIREPLYNAGKNVTKAFEKFDLTGKTALITGAAGLLGVRHAGALLESGATVVLTDIGEVGLASATATLSLNADAACILTRVMDVTRLDSIRGVAEELAANGRRVDILINNAAIDPKVEGSQSITEASRLESFPLAQWDLQISVGLTGAFLCSQVFGGAMAHDSKGGVILNIASDLSVFSPDQRLYRKDGLSDEMQPVKPVTYSVIKAGLIGLTRYLATYWADRGVRANALSPGGVFNGQDEEFVQRLASLIPLGRMANHDEYLSAVQFLCSDASAYLNGQNIVMDGGRSVW